MPIVVGPTVGSQGRGILALRWEFGGTGGFDRGPHETAPRARKVVRCVKVRDGSRRRRRWTACFCVQARLRPPQRSVEGQGDGGGDPGVLGKLRGRRCQRRWRPGCWVDAGHLRSKLPQPVLGGSAAPCHGRSVGGHPCGMGGVCDAGGGAPLGSQPCAAALLAGITVAIPLGAPRKMPPDLGGGARASFGAHPVGRPTTSRAARAP
mmetsp:Transcript_103343/g.291792  ORF Transcript_103343/g.291792 Transcript_103343/m.291792 type:complete len:207 (-) Transcript_103343:774-1394(-)